MLLYANRHKYFTNSKLNRPVCSSDWPFKVAQ
jgi:hypothetical protein